MNKNDKDFMERLTDLDDESVEEIAQDYPALDEKAQKRILKQCLRKSGLPDGDIEITQNTGIYEDDSDEDEISVSGIERYERPLWHKYVSSVAVMAVAVIGIASVVLLKGNLVSNDDFDISSPPVVSDVAPQTQVTEIVSGSYIDKGYHAGGHDFANDSDYQGIVVGNATAPADSSVSDNVPDNTNPPEVNYDLSENNSPETPPPATNPPVTSPPATTPSATAPAVTETSTAPVSTEPPTEAQAESQKIMLEGLYYVSFPDNSGHMGFEFMPDGTLKKYWFYEDGVIHESTIVEGLSYELTENSFVFGDFSSEIGTKSGKLTSPYDGTGFTVEFEDGVYIFSKQAPQFEESPGGIFLEGVWYGNSAYGLRKFKFVERTGGTVTYIESGESCTFNYEIPDGTNAVFWIYSYDNQTTGTVDSFHEGSDMVISWDDGTIESFYSEQKWLEMNQ